MNRMINLNHPLFLGKKLISTLNCFNIYYNKKNYIVSVHHGYPIENVIIDNVMISTFNNMVWNELLIIEDNTIPQFVFKKFSKKQIADNEYYYFGENNRLKFITNHSMPLNMIPGNPRNLYYKMKSLNTQIKKGDSGSPVYCSNNKLVGIISKIEDDIVYIIPVIYLLKSLEKYDNMHIYIPNRDTLDDIVKIDNFNVENKMVYHSSLKTNILLDTYFVLEGDVSNHIVINDEILEYKVFNNNIINNNEIIISKNNIKITSALLNLIKLINDNKKLINIIFVNMREKKGFVYKKLLFNY